MYFSDPQFFKNFLKTGPDMNKTEVPHQWLSSVLTETLRYCMAHELDDVALRLSQAKKSLADRQNCESDACHREDRITLMLALEACFHISESLGYDDVRQSISLAMELLDGKDHASSVLKLDPKGTH